MKRICLTLLLLVLSSSGAQLRAQGTAYAFGNETLCYAIGHNLVPGHIGTMTFHGTDEGDTYRIEAVLNAAIASLYTLDCTYGSTFRKDPGLTPVSATRRHIEKKYWVKSRYDWSAPGSVHLDISKSSRAPRNEMLEWPGTVRDLVCAIWWLRTRDYSRPVPDGANALLLDHEPLPIRIASAEHKTIRRGGKSVPVIEVAVVQGEKEGLKLTFTDDAHRLPLRFAISLPFGTIKGTLKE